MKKFTALFLVFSLMMLSMNLYAKKRGAKLIITRNDGIQFKGELILVKKNFLLMFAREGKDVSVDIKDIEKIVIVKKSKARLVAGAGGLIGIYAGGYIGYSYAKAHYYDFVLGVAFVGALIGSVIGSVIGRLIGKSAIPDKVILIEGMTDQEIQEALDYLRKKARIRDYN